MSLVGTSLIFSAVSSTPKWRVAERQIRQQVRDAYTKTMTGHEPMKVTRFVDGQPFELSQEDIERRITDDELRMRKYEEELADVRTIRDY